jgi:hypothetical protein
MAHLAEPSTVPPRGPAGPTDVGLSVDPLAEAPALTADGTDGGWLRDAWPPLLVLLSGAVVLGLVLLDAPASVRATPVLAYIAVVPGLACVRLLRLTDRWMGLLLGIGLSLALGIVVAQAMVYLHRWSPLLGLSTLTVIATPAALFELFRGRLGSRLRQPRRRRSS